ncbi:MAG: PD40 domain-containing protein [Myxococcales bacterium]|nr:PD40 domain-containing protein [Myxococcales bacterium]
MRPPTSDRGRVALLSVVLLGACVLDNPLFGDGEGSASEGASASAGTLTGSASAGTTTSGGSSATMGGAGPTTTGAASESSGDATGGGTTDTGTSGGEATPPELCGRPIEALVFTEIENVAAINGPNFEGDPSLAPDGLTLFYSRDAPSYDIFYARRASPDEPFIDMGSAQAVLGLNTDARDTKVSLSDDGLRVWVGSSREGSMGKVDVWYGERADIGVPFGPVTNVSTVNTPDEDYDPQITSDELELFLAPQVGASQWLAVARRASPDLPFDPPLAIAELMSDQNESNPAISRDGRVIVFASGRSGGGDLYVAAREAPGAPFGPPLPIDALNDPGHYEGEPFIAEHAFGCEIYFVSDRSGAGAWDVWRARIAPL